MEALTPFIVKYKHLRLSYCSLVILSMPVVSSRTAPVAFLYASKASVARRMRVVPVSAMPAVFARIGVLSAYLIDWSMPT